MYPRRVASVFIYAFASMIVPVVLILAIDGYANQTLTNWIESNVAVTIFACLLYGLIQILLIFQMGSWAAAVQPKSKIRLPSDELRRRLLSTSDDKLPFVIAQDPKHRDRIVASWKIADEKWIELFAARKLRIQYELRMKLVDAKGIIKAQDNFKRFEYEAGAVKFASSYSFFKGIIPAQYERGFEYGIIYKDGRIKIDYAYNYTFSPAEIKNPIVNVVTSSGWEFRPVVFLR